VGVWVIPLPENFDESQIAEFVAAHIPDGLEELEGARTKDDPSLLSRDQVKKMLVNFAIEKQKPFWFIVDAQKYATGIGTLYTRQIEYFCRNLTSLSEILTEMEDQGYLLDYEGE
jgi:hypothetical protein